MLADKKVDAKGVEITILREDLKMALKNVEVLKNLRHEDDMMVAAAQAKGKQAEGIMGSMSRDNTKYVSTVTSLTCADSITTLRHTRSRRSRISLLPKRLRRRKPGG